MIVAVAAVAGAGGVVDVAGAAGVWVCVSAGVAAKQKAHNAKTSVFIFAPMAANVARIASR
jgi:hypothetical protein